MSAEVTARILQGNAPPNCPRLGILNTPNELLFPEAEDLEGTDGILTEFNCMGSAKAEDGAIVPVGFRDSTNCADCKGCKLKGGDIFVASTGERVRIGQTVLT